MSEDIDIVVTRRPRPEAPEPFTCCVCQRVITADPWRPERHQPPVCFYCSTCGGHQVRIPGMTRGDHHTLQRLSAVTSALVRAATWEPKYARQRSI